MATSRFGYRVGIAVMCCSVSVVSAQQAPQSIASTRRPGGRPVATVQDLMLAMVDPSSDVVFEAVSTTISIRGQETKTPKNDHEWAVVRNNALTLVEAGNLLMMPGRRIASPASIAAADALAESSTSVAEKASAIELTPDQIAKLVASDRATWIARAQELVAAATRALNATETPEVLVSEEQEMMRWLLSLTLVCAVVPVVAWQPSTAAGGSIQGRVRLTAPPPGNPIIRMGMDPRCAEAARGKRIVQDAVVTSDDGGLANAFVHLAGSFPDAPRPAGVVTIDQQRCMYRPRVVGARVGQTIEFRNSDPTLHDVHGLSKASNDFNIGQPLRGMVYKVELKHEEVMLHIACDVHRWMTAFVGVVDHPY
ncbi:MAG: hypothetical protein DMG03_09955, partial [Acidobacteria bacterium]